MPPVAQTTHYLKPTLPEEAAQAVCAAFPTLHSPSGTQALTSPPPSCSPTPLSPPDEPFEGLHGHTLRASPQAVTTAKTRANEKLFGQKEAHSLKSNLLRL